MHKFVYFLLTILIYVSAKQSDEKKKDHEQTLSELSSQAKWRPVQTSYIEGIKLLLFSVAI